MIKSGKLSRVIAVVLMTASFISACAPGNTQLPATKLTDSEVQSFADPVAENILQAMNTSNYVQYTRDFDDQFKENFPEIRFQAFNSYRTDVVGSYISKEFRQFTPKDQKTSVAYEVKFSEEPSTATVTVYFKNISGKYLVDGLFFDSPLIRAHRC